MYNAEVTYSIAAARSEIAAIIDQVETGQAVELTRHGKPVAVVISLKEYDRLRGERARFADRYAAFRRRFNTGDTGLPEDFAASLRDNAPGRRVLV